MIGSRSRSREIALQVLYSCDHENVPDRACWQLTLEDTEASPEVKAFARELVDGVLAQRDEIDRLIAGAAENWDLSRLAVVDRNVLRLSVHELLGRRDIPAKVSINEAIELGKRFSTAQSGAFINGILDRIRRDLNLPVDNDPADDVLAESQAGSSDESRADPLDDERDVTRADAPGGR
jgi:transcription antitermination protein NusB